MCCMKTNGEKILRNAICVVVYIWRCLRWRTDSKLNSVVEKKTKSVIANKMPCNRRIKECYSKNKSSFYWDCTFMVCIFTIEILFFNSSPPPRLVPLLRLRILKTDALFRRLNFTNIPIRVHHNYHLGGLLNQWSLQNSFQSNKLFANCDLFARKSTHRLLCHVIQLCSRIPNTLPFYAVLFYQEPLWRHITIFIVERSLHGAAHEVKRNACNLDCG